uniref:Uncharacterized protein n=1 Tax=Kalanchoe fedtschenkoi TaxID=63787 RepID=A0A7N0RH42_KALFE
MEHATTASSSTRSKASNSGSISVQVSREWDSGMEEFIPGIMDNQMHPQVLTILEHFVELYIEHKDMLRRLFKGSQEDMWEMIKKLKEEIFQIKSKKRNERFLSRSLSVGSPRRSSGDDDGTKLDRFKIKTLDVKQGGAGVQVHQGGASK